MPRTRSTSAQDALRLLGLQLAEARRERGWQVQELAERAGVSRATVRAAEAGRPTVAVGTVFELAVLTGVPLLAEDVTALPGRVARAQERLAVLPQRIRTPEPVDDDF